jgi:alkylhydroperoxidase family enzyme
VPAVPKPLEREITLDRLRKRVLEGPGQLDATVRKAAFLHEPGSLPDEVAAYVTKVHGRAYEVTDQDVAALRGTGLTEDQIFELTIAAAVGAGLSRLDAARSVRGAT